MQVLLTGATGYIGSAVADALRGAGHEVSGLARSDASAARLTAMGIRPVPGDMVDPATVVVAAREAEGVISAATTNDPGADSAAVAALLGALRGSGKPFVYTSGIWTYGDTGGRVVTETGPATPVPLVAWRTPVERAVLQSAGDGIRSVVIQPAVVYGRAGGIPAQFVKSARRDGAARFVGTGENRWPLVHVDDLAELYVRALERAPAGTLLIAVAGPSVRVADMARAASEGAGAGGKVQASSRRAEELLDWKPFRPGVLDELRHGSYTGGSG